MSTRFTFRQVLRNVYKAAEKSIRVCATVVDSVGNTLGLTSTGEAKVSDGACISAQTIRKNINNEELAAVGTANLVGRKAVLIQPLNGDLKFGHTSGELHHQLTRGNFYEAQISDIVNLYIEADGGTVKVAISEFK